MTDFSSSVNSLLLDPDYIKFLLDPDLKFSCYFVVGNAQLAPVEKIGVVKEMLSAHSEVFRTQLLNRQWESKEPVKISDILPATFKNLLRFVYGFDTTSALSFEDADDLLYVADRYIMNRLMDKLATRLMSLLDYTNICSLLTNPACARVLELNSEMNKILQCETDKVLASPQFLSCCPDTFVKILEQEVMNVTELDVWRAALSWAKNKGTISDAQPLRRQLEKPLHYIRVCTLSPDELSKDVVPTGILTDEEVEAVFTAVVTKNVPKTLTAVCSNMQVRVVLSVEYVKSEELSVSLDEGVWLTSTIQNTSFSLQTHSLALEVVGLGFCVLHDEGEFTVTVNIETDEEPATTVTHTDNNIDEPEFIVPVSTEERPVVLSPNTKYTFTVSCDADLAEWEQYRGEKILEHFTLQFTQYNGQYGSLVDAIHYKTLTRQ